MDNTVSQDVLVPEPQRTGWHLSALAALAALSGLLLTRLYSYLLFHSLVELFSIVVALGVFVVAWNARSFLQNNYLLFIGIACLFVGGIDLVHTLAYKGMGVFAASDANPATQLWIAARSLEAASLVAAPLFIGRRLNHRPVLAVYAAASALLVWSILSARIFPDCFREGAGLTPFKIYAEYAISGTLLAAMVLLLRKRDAFDRRVFRFLFLALFATIGSELAFTFYAGVYDLSNLLGHVLKLVAFSCLFSAIVSTGLRRPYDLIFRDLEQSRKALQQAKGELSVKVEERTRELSLSNELYRRELAERAKVEEALRISAAYTRSLIEASLDPLVTIGRDGRITDVNAATEEITGRKRRDLVGTDFSEYFTDPEKAREGYRRAFLSGQVRDYPLEILHDGSPVPVLYNATVYRDAAGEVSGVFAAARDVTVLRKAEKALREGEQRYKLLVESVTDYIYTVRVADRRPVATEHGPGCVAVTGYQPQEYAADPYLWYRMIYDEDRPAVEAQASRILSGEPVDPVEHRVRHKDGSLRWVRNTPVPRYDAQGALVSYDGLISDITERKRLEEQLSHSQRMEAIGRLAGGIAHDFNNILSAVMGYGHLLHMKMKENDPLRANVQHLLDAADRAANLTHSLLAFSRKQIINPADVELNEIIPRTGKFLRRIIGEDIDLQTVFRKDRITVHADSGQLEQIFMNLATNARDAMQRGGRFVIEADTVELDDSFIRAHGYGRRGWFALISVSDTGAGMDAAVLKRLFEPFFTTKEQGKGTGLGLSMVYGIVKQHDGYITVYSEPGGGTVFRIYLPLVAPSERKAPADAVPLREVPRGGETVLLAEDDDAVRKLTASVLSDFGYTVIEAADGREAVDVFLRDRDRISLVILDMIMPKMNGREVYEELRTLKKDLRTLFVTGYTADKLFTEGLLSQGAETLLKPFSPRTLLEKVRMVLDKT